MKKPFSFLLLTAACLAASGHSLAQDAICGTAPSLPTTAESSASVKGNLQGQADFLSKLVGKAELAGEIENAKKTIYQNTDKFFAAQKDAYLSYIFCVLIMQDKTLSTPQKLDALEKYRGAPIPKTSSTPAKNQLSPEQAYQTGWKLYSDHNYAAALVFLRQAATAEIPHTGAVETIAYMYDNGYGVEEDHVEALRWWKKAAMLGSGPAVRQLCAIYERGFFNIQPDKAEATHWCVEAAVRGVLR